ncbi:MAG TPA: signal peptidase I [Chthonomonas sp.]|uniref:signal peptidase I n=1 Tax=Chthonomonas sp. TaxID=2282153 RepID=UPI002B4AADEE|nr:signal peptidase I [Chthonomonas sp.]HLI49167.1 signal peptidase I [Chthonomonas sp.]
MTPTPHETGALEFFAYLSTAQVAFAALILTIVRVFALQRYKAAIEAHRAVEDAGSFWAFIAEICESFLVAGVLVFFIIRPFFIQAFYIPTESMENTLMGHDTYDPTTGQTYAHAVHDRIFVNKLIYRFTNPKRGDVIVFRAPKAADSDDIALGKPLKENILIKRVIGIPGDTIQIKQVGSYDYVFRNGVQLNEYHNLKLPYSIKDPMDPSLNPNFKYGYETPVHLGPGQYWVMGDNRNYSFDSRYWGVVTRNRIIGKAFFIFWPLNRIGFIH